MNSIKYNASALQLSDTINNYPEWTRIDNILTNNNKNVATCEIEIQAPDSVYMCEPWNKEKRLNSHTVFKNELQKGSRMVYPLDLSCIDDVPNEVTIDVIFKVDGEVIRKVELSFEVEKY